jgi:Transglutaminase-like superfamily
MSLDFWRQPTGFSDASSEAPRLDGLPRDPTALATIVQGLLIHEHMPEMYGVAFDQARHAEAHVRGVEAILQGIAGHDPRPLIETRRPEKRQVAVCRSFALLHVAMLRRQSLPARARCGFGSYFERGKFYDHWVTEWWNEGEKRWVLTDAQVDDKQRAAFQVSIDTLDVSREKFLVAGDAWQLCRAGKLDPASFGILDMHGLWFIASNVIRDLAALNNREMLPWDTWGAMVLEDDKLDLALIDRLAALTHAPDVPFDDLRLAYRDHRLVVPATVFNHVLGRPEAALSEAA